MSTLNFDVFWRDRGAAKGLQSLSKEAEKTHTSFEKVQKTTSGFGSLTGLAFKAAGVAAVGYGLKVASANEQAQVSFTTMLGSAKKADVFLKQLQQFAATTPFEFPELQTAAQSLISAGVEANKVIPIMRTLGDVTSGMGTGAEGVKRATVAIQQMNAAGRITAEDLNQLRDAGIPVYDLLAKATGKSKTELVAMAQAGKLGRQELEQLMTALESGKGLEKFNGMMEQQSKTLAGMISTLKDLSGQMLSGWLTPLFPALKASVGALADMSDGTKTAAGIVAGSAIVFGTAAAGALKLAGAFRTLGLTASTARIAVGGVGAALGVATLAFGLYANEHAKSKARVEDFTQALHGETAAVKENVAAVAAKQLQDAGALDAAQKLGLSLDTVTRAALGEQSALNEVNAVIDSYIEAGLNSADVDAIDRANAASDLSGAIRGTGSAYNKAVGDAKQMEAATKDSAAAMGGMEKKTKSSKEELAQWRQEMSKAADAALELQGSQDAVEAAIDDATQSVKDNGKTLDSNTEKGRNNREALRRLAQTSNAYRDELTKQGASTKKVNQATDDAREAFIKVGRRMGLTKEDAQQLADKFGLLKRNIDKVPKNPSIKLTAKFNANASKSAIAMLKFIPGSQASGFANQLQGRAEGGPIPGWSPHPKADNIPIMATAGEYMQQKSAVDYYGKSTMDALNKRRIPKEAIGLPTPGPTFPGYALGGPLPKVGPYGTYAKQANERAAKLAWEHGYALANKRYADAVAASAGPGGGGGSVPAGKGWGPVYAAARKAGARNFTTYAGHDQGASRSRDITPPSWAIANAVRRLQSVWYVIYNRHIASITYGRKWRPYTRYGPNASPSQAHTNHVHVTLRPGYNKGGAVSNLAKPANLVRITSGGAGPPGGKVGGDTYIINAPNYVGDKKDLVKALTDLDRQGRLTVVRGR